MSFKSLTARLLKLARDQVFKLDDIAIRQGIQWADNTLDTFERKLESKIGFDLPIPWTLEGLFASKLIALSNKAQEKLIERSKVKADEREERKAERNELEASRSARHTQALADIKAEYRAEIKRIDDLTNRSTFSTIIRFLPPPDVTTVVILGKPRTVIEDIKPYTKEFDGDLKDAIVNGDYRELIAQGADFNDVSAIDAGFFSLGQGRTKRTIVGDDGVIDPGDYGFELVEVKENKKGLDRVISFEEETRLRRTALYKYQADLREENDKYAEEREQFRAEDRQKNEDERKQKRENRGKRDKEKREKLTPEERAARKQERQNARNTKRDDRKDRRDDNKDERKEKRDNKKKDRKDRRDDNKQRRDDNERRRKNNRKLLDDAREARNDEEAEFDRDLDQAIEELDFRVEIGQITEAQKREILRDIREEEKVDVNSARDKIREVKAGNRQSNKAFRNQKKEQKNRGARKDRDPLFDTSMLKDPAFVRTIYQQTYQFLPQQDKDALAITLAEYQTVLNKTVKSLSIIQASIISVQGILNILSKTGTTLGIVSDSVETATRLITTLAIPTGAPIGVGLPLNIITQLAQTLDQLITQSEKVNGASDLIADATPPIAQKLEDTLQVINTLLDVITIIFDLVVFINYIAQSGATSLEEIRNGLGQELNNALAQSGNSSNPGQNVSEEEDLLARLAPNSNDPLFYKGFRLTLQYVTNDGELTQTRVLGVNETNGVSLATELSFTNSPEVLVQEMQFQIDNYNLIFVNDPNISIEDQLDTIDLENLEGFQTIIPSTDIEDIEIPGLPPRFTAKQIRQLKRKDRRSDKKERREARQAGEITRREARKDRKQDRKERKQQSKGRRRNRIRKKEG